MATPSFAPVDEGLDLPWYKKLDRGIDSAFEYTGAPQLAKTGAGWVGSGFDALFNTNITPTLESVGETLPRAMIESLLSIPLAASGAGAPAAGAIWANRLRQLAPLGKALGYGSAATKGYAETDSPLGALVGAGSLGFGNYALPVAGRGAESAVMKFLGRNADEIDPTTGFNLLSPRPTISATSRSERYLPGAGKLGAEVGTATGINEATRQGMLSVGPNAVPWDDPQRDPFTAENIAANVAGGIGFAPQILGTFLAPRRVFSGKRVEDFAKWDQNRKAAEADAAGYDYEGGNTPEAQIAAYDEAYTKYYANVAKQNQAFTAEPLRSAGLKPTDSGSSPIPESSDIAYGKSEREVRSAVVLNMLEAYRVQTQIGDSLAPETKRRLVDIFMSPEGEQAFVDVGALETVANHFEDVARNAPPQSRKGFDKFMGELNNFIDYLNKNTAELDQVYKTSKKRGETWHPDATSSFAIEQLQELGALEKVTEATLKRDYNLEFLETGDSQFAYDVTIQKNANRVWSSVEAVKREVAKRLLDQVKAAKEKTVRHAVSTVDELSDDARLKHLALKEETEQFITALNSLPENVQKDFNERSAVFFRSGTWIAGDKSLNRGRSVDQFSNWRKAVIRAAKSYNPEDGTILLGRNIRVDNGKGGKKIETVFDRVSIGMLIEKGDGQYKWFPKEAVTPTAEGGRGTIKVGGKTHVEGSLEGLRAETWLPDEIADENVRTVSRENTDRLLPKLPKIREFVQSAPIDQLERLVEPAFATMVEGRPRRDPVGVEGRRPVLRLAILAAMEHIGQDVKAVQMRVKIGEHGRAFLEAQAARGKVLDGPTEGAKLLSALGDFFKKKTKVEGGKTGDPLKDRLAQVLTLLGDDGRVKAVMEEGKPLAMSNLGKQIDSPEFKQWFTGSKVVNSEGKPLRVYHGTPDASFQVFEQGKNKGSFAATDGAYYFTPDAQYAEMYVNLREGQAPGIVPVFLALKNPLVVARYGEIAHLTKQKVAETKAAGYDGLIFKDKNGKIIEYAVFEPTQIKSATGNAGKFDPKNPNILASGPTTEKHGSSQFINTQPDGSFVHDTTRTLRDFFTRIFGDAGYGGTLRNTYTEMAVTIAKQMDGLPVDFYRLGGDESRGMVTWHKGRGKMGVRLDEADVREVGPIAFANSVLETLAHEISHLDSMILHDLIQAPDAFSARRKVQLTRLFQLGEALQPEERHTILDTINRVLTPAEARLQPKLPGSPLLYGSQNAEEFVATLNGFITQSLAKGKSTGVKDIMSAFDFSPQEVREYVQGTYRSLGDVLGAAADSIALGKGENLRSKKLVGEALYAAGAAAKAASRFSDIDYMLLQGKQVMGVLSPGAASFKPLPPSPAYWFREEGPTGKPEPLAMARISDAVGEGFKALTGADGTGHYKAGLFETWFAPFATLMHGMDRAGVPLARPMAKLALELEGRVSRARSNMLAPFIVPDKAGGYKWNPDNALIARLSKEKNGPWRKEIDRLSAWQQENGAQSLIIRGQDAKLTVNEALLGATEQWARTAGHFSPEDQHFIMSTMSALDDVEQIRAQYLTKSLGDTLTHKTAMFLMATDPRMPHEIALGTAQRAFQAVEQATVAGVPVDPTVFGLDPKRGAQVGALLGGPEGLVMRYLQAKGALEGRPGHRSESLPTDWLVRFKTPEGETKFLSADSKGRAEDLMKRLEKEGNFADGPIVHKDMLKDQFTGLEDSDAFLAKFTALEGAAWEQFVAGIEKTDGGEIAAKLRQYVPGVATQQEQAAKGVQKFLTERKSMIDRSRFDYIDGTMAGVSKLAAAVEYKRTRQMKDLILQDPRGRQFPEFRKMVEPHLENLMSPTSDLTRKLKTGASAYFIGGNLASAAINGTQSLTTLVPALIQQSKSGGVVEAYGLLGRGLKTATRFSLSNDWVAVAEQAQLKNPKFWTLDEAQSWVYKKSIDEGGIAHGIIHDDIFTPNDQKLMMISKFGHGDYGPVTKSEMVGNAAFVGAQLSMKPFGWVEAFNNKISIAAAVEQGWKQGLRGEALMDHARTIKVLSTFGGGKANAPGFVGRLSTDSTRSAVAILTTLQQYGLGLVSSYAQLGKEAFGRVSNLSSQERRQAQKAFATMLTTQTALAGALGLPFAGAALAMLEKVFGIQANSAVREGLASLGTDDETGAVIAETALNGLGNQLFGLDVSSRLGVSSFLGTSSYRGFNLQDMVGPVGSIMGNMVEGLSLFAQGQPERAAKALVPAAMKNLVEMVGSQAKYGDTGIRDRGENLLHQPTTSEAAWYVAGLRPSALSAKRQAQGLLKLADEQAGSQQDRAKDDLARRLLQGDAQSAVRAAQERRFADPTLDPQEFLRSVTRRAVDSVTEKDLLATGSAASEQNRTQIARTFGPQVIPRQSETTRALLEAQLGAQVGLTPSASRFRRAALVDMLVESQRMPRSAAVRLAEFLTGGDR